MHALHEALAREHLREQRRLAQRDALAAELSAVRRWHRLERRALAAQRRQTRRASRTAQALAVAK